MLTYKLLLCSIKVNAKVNKEGKDGVETFSEAETKASLR